MGDGALGFWKALAEVFPTTRPQRCWMHKTGNVLNCFPKNKHATVKTDIHQVWMASTRQDAEHAFDAFLEKYEAKYPKATHCLAKDRDELLAFYDFPAEHWQHLRTTKSDRVDVRHGAPAASEDQGVGYAQRVPRHGLQASSGRGEEVAPPQRRATDPRPHRRSSFQGWSSR